MWARMEGGPGRRSPAGKGTLAAEARAASGGRRGALLALLGGGTGLAGAAGPGRALPKKDYLPAVEAPPGLPPGAAIEARQAAGEAVAAFIGGDLEVAEARFDAARALNPELRPYLWQRGIAKYYLGKFDEAAEQFGDDMADPVFPNDVEEVLWRYLAEARIYGPARARARLVEAGSGYRDRRPFMRAAFRAYADGEAPPVPASSSAEAGGGSERAAFYATFYAALWHESQGHAAEARALMRQAAGLPYGREERGGRGDFMASVADCAARGWPL